MTHPERSSLIEFLRGELVGPIRSAGSSGGRKRYEVKGFGQVEPHPAPEDYGAWLYWKPEGADGDEEEILSIAGGRNPHRAYGVGILHPEPQGNIAADPVDVGIEQNGDENTPASGEEVADQNSESAFDSEEQAEASSENKQNAAAPDEDLEINSSDATRPSSMAISFCVRLDEGGEIVVSLPRSRRLPWQHEAQAPFPLNGIYEPFGLRREQQQKQIVDRAYRRRSAVARDAQVRFPRKILSGNANREHRSRNIPKAPGTRDDLRLEIQVYPRPHEGGALLLTVVMRNRSVRDDRDLALFQSCFEVTVEGGEFLPYPESPRPFKDMDDDEQSMELLYRRTSCWAIGHGCAAGWNEDGEGSPAVLTADVMPTVELPSMTPDIELNGESLKVSMSDLARLPEPADHDPGAWGTLTSLVERYRCWISDRNVEIQLLPARLREVAGKHMATCARALERMDYGLSLLRKNSDARQAFRWANEAMLLQQVALKQIRRREATWDRKSQRPVLAGTREDPFQILSEGKVHPRLGSWRAFQIAFLLMSLRGMVESGSDDRELVDLVWFPTGGGKTEAYLGVAAFQMFHQRLLMTNDEEDFPKRDGTNVLMRYTLRMLTTDQFQRAAGLICGMEAMRRRENGRIPGEPFRLGLWLGSNGTPNKRDKAKTEIGRYKRNRKHDAGNPLVLTECPWCRTMIGRVESGTNTYHLVGIVQDDALMHCPDRTCIFADDDHGLPIDVIDECIYEHKPSLVIGTADKFAMLAYESKAGSLFGRSVRQDGGVKKIAQSHLPPSLIIQDELHLISGPLGTLFGLYETVIGDLSTFKQGSRWQLPKIIASTATVRGADKQVQALFARDRTALFPPPGLEIADSFFGRYAKCSNGSLAPGRLYVGIHALYGSMQTTQARAFAAVLARAATFADGKKDPWWTLLAYYNSMRELAGARMLFDSDIRSRLSHIAGRESLSRNTLFVQELSSRLSQAQIVAIKDRLSNTVESGKEDERVDACLSSNIIEVGVDIDRLSLMAVVGQPKSTASYIQATGRVGRRWEERPGLILAMLNPYKSRDASHFEQFHSYHRRLYERVEPTSATPFSLTALQRGLVGAAIAYSKQQVFSTTPDFQSYRQVVDKALDIFRERCESIGLESGDAGRSSAELERQFDKFKGNWDFFKPEYWFDWNQPADGRFLMLVPGKFATAKQKNEGFPVPTSLRDVDAQAELAIDYFQEDSPSP